MSCFKRLFCWLLPVFAFIVAGIFLPGAVQAAISFSGNVSPAASSDWNSDTNGYIGNTAAGTITIDASDTLEAKNGYIAYGSSVAGIVTVDGAGSTWSLIGQWATGGGPGGPFGDAQFLGGELYIGYSGDGTLHITNGGVVSTASIGNLGYNSNGAGLVQVDGIGSKWELTGCADTGYGSVNSTLFVGRYGNGMLSITNGGTVSNNGVSYIGHSSTGIATVTGASSTWVNAGDLYVGLTTFGSLTITSGGGVENTDGAVYVNCSTGAVGSKINFGAGGGTLTALSLYTAPSDLMGTGAIDAYGLVSDVNNLTLDGIATKTFTINANVTMNLDMSNSSMVGDLGAGYQGNGSLTIQNGATVYSTAGYLGYRDAASGTATVTGTGSTWNNTGDLYVGKEGSGVLNIVAGGVVSNGVGFIGYDGPGTVTVSGNGSTWNNSNLYVSNSGTASQSTLNINNGGAVTVTDATYIGVLDNTGTINFGAGGGTLTTKSLYVASTQLAGTGTISVHGLVGDGFNPIFDAAGTTTIAVGQVNMTLDMNNSANVGDLGAGYHGSDALTIQNGATVTSATGYLGCQFGSSGTATVTGTGSSWTNTGDFYVGYDGSGKLYIDAGGAVNNNGTSYIGCTYAMGEATVDGTGSMWNNGGELYIGGFMYSAHQGALNITNGGTVTNTNGYIRSDMDFWSNGTVDGVDSTWTNTGNLIIGNGVGNALLSIANGASVSSVNGFIIGAPGMMGPEVGSVIVDGAGSTWTNSGNLAVGNSGGNATLIITNGGSVSSVNGYIIAGEGMMGAETSSVTVHGADSTWTNTGAITIGNDDGGIGILNITGSGTVVTNSVVGGVVMMGNPAMTVNFDGGVLKAYSGDNSTWIAPGGATANVYVKAGGATFNTNGHNMGIEMVLQHSGGIDTDGGITKTGDGTLTLSGPNTYDGPTTIQAGTLALVGVDTGTPSAWDAVLTGGGADIQSGKLVFYYAGGTSPAGTIATILDDSYGTSNPFSQGNGAQIYCTFADADHGLGWLDDGVDEVAVMYTLYGDSNLDGSVNGTDLNAVLSYYNQSDEVWNHGDFNYDGSVNGTDLNTVLSNYNQSLPASTAAVPEPSSLLLVAMALLGLLAWRKRLMI